MRGDDYLCVLGTFKGNTWTITLRVLIMRETNVIIHKNHVWRAAVLGERVWNIKHGLFTTLLLRALLLDEL
jgi:hypothetical protein